MTVSFADLTERTRQVAFTALEEWPENRHTTGIIDSVMVMAFSTALPRLDQVDGDWVMQMMWQVPDLLETSTYSDGMDVNATVRAGELGLDPDRLRI